MYMEKSYKKVVGCGFDLSLSPFTKKNAIFYKKRGIFFPMYRRVLQTHNPQPPIINKYVDKNYSCKVINLACICSKNEK